MQTLAKAASGLYVFLLSLAVSLFFGSVAALAADSPLEVKSFHMMDQGGQDETEVTYFYQIVNNGDVPVSDVTITDSNCPYVFYDGINQDVNVNAMLEKGEVWSYHCKTTGAAQTASAVSVSGLLEESEVNADTTSNLRIPGSSASVNGEGAEEDGTGANGESIGVETVGDVGGLNFDAVPDGMPNTGKGGTTISKPAKSAKSVEKKMKSVKKPVEHPKTLVIPATGTNANIEKVGKTEQGNMEVPSNDDNVGLYGFGTVPGEKGNAVIAGHLDTNTDENGVFGDLHELVVGDDVYVLNDVGKESHFKVNRVVQYKASEAPLRQIFGPSDKARLNLITCAGKWDRKAHQYTHRLVVYTEMAG